MDWFFQKIWLRLYGQWVLRYIKKDRTYAYAGIQVKVPSGVFHPGLFFTTTMFVDFLKPLDLRGKSVVDVGTGSGLLALFAAKKGAIVTAIDINPLAVATCLSNAALNEIKVNVVESDLFDALPNGTTYDCVVINPPYFAAAPADNAAHAFFAGENLEYFEKLFRQLPIVSHVSTKIWMILCDDCDLNKIHQIATKNGFSSSLLLEKKKWTKRMMVMEYLLV